MNAKEFAEKAHSMAKLNLNQIARMWIEGPASDEEWERESIKMHEEQRRRSDAFYANESAGGGQSVSLTRS